MPLPPELDKAFTFELKNMLINKLNIQNKDNLEIEARLGSITEVFTSERLRLNTFHPVILEPSHDTRFKTGVALNYFTKIKDLFKNETGTIEKDSVCLYKGFRTTLSNGKTTTIRKDRIAAYDIYIPNAVYDLRIALSREIPVTNVMKRTSYRRERERESFVVDDSRFDFTVTKSEGAVNYEVEVELVNASSSLDAFVDVAFNVALLNLQ